jgi:DNA processing protein
LRALDPGHPEYPVRLRDLSSPPSPIFLRGPWNHAGPIVAVVGSRNARPEAIEFTRWLAGALAREGVAVVSGLARGIDAEAHKGALEAGGRSGGVLGTPLDEVYPPENRSLQEELAASLGLMSEVAPGAPTTRGTFATRNRILAAISHAVILVQADVKSGALLTVRAAERLRRPIGAVPWNPTDELAASPLALIREGRAVLIRDARDVLTLMGEAPSSVIAAAATAATPAAAAPASVSDSRSGIERRVLAELGRRAEPLDVVATRADLPAAETSAALLSLELAGLARREPGGRYRLAPRA